MESFTSPTSTTKRKDRRVLARNITALLCMCTPSSYPICGLHHQSNVTTISLLSELPPRLLSFIPCDCTYHTCNQCFVCFGPPHNPNSVVPLALSLPSFPTAHHLTACHTWSAACLQCSFRNAVTRFNILLHGNPSRIKVVANTRSYKKPPFPSL